MKTITWENYKNTVHAPVYNHLNTQSMISKFDEVRAQLALM